MKKILLVCAAFVSTHCLSAPVSFPSWSEVVTTPEREITIVLENTSGMSDGEALFDLVEVLKQDPQFQGDLLHVTVGNATADVNLVYDMTPQRETKGDKTVLEVKSSQWATDVGAVVKGATGGISGSAKIGVKVSHTETKKDGTSTTTQVDVTIDVTAAKK